MLITKETTSWRILVVDDEPDNLRLAGDLLEYLGAAVQRAKDGQQALEMADSFKPNLILLDLAMPGLDGWELQRRWRARPEFDLVPIVALTALVMQPDVDKIHAQGFDAYVAKPFRITAMIDELKACIDRFTKRKVPGHST